MYELFLPAPRKVNLCLYILLLIFYYKYNIYWIYLNSIYYNIMIIS